MLSANTAKQTSANPAPIGNPPVNQDEYQPRRLELQKKEYLTCEEDRELQLLGIPEYAPYAARMSVLEFIEDRTPTEERELSLLRDPSSRSVAHRILELEAKKNLSQEELIELHFIVHPETRPYANGFLALYRKPVLTEEEYRHAKFYGNESTIKNADEIVRLEGLNKHTPEDIAALSKCYLTKLSNLTLYTQEHFPKNMRDTLYNPDVNCMIRDAYCYTYDRGIASYRAIEDAVNAAAAKLNESYFIQSQYAFAAPSSNPSFFTQSILENPRVQALLKARQAPLALVIEKLFFDYDIKFNQENLDTIVNYLNDQVQNRKLLLNDTSFLGMNAIVRTALKDALPGHANEAAPQVQTARPR